MVEAEVPKQPQELRLCAIRLCAADGDDLLQQPCSSFRQARLSDFGS